MSDLIERRAAIDALCDNCDNVQAVCPHYPCKQYTTIEALPSAHSGSCEYYDTESHYCALNRPSAQPEIIRCKDCVDYDTSWIPHSAPDRHYCPTMDTFMPDDGYCSYAERKTDG